MFISNLSLNVELGRFPDLDVLRVVDRLVIEDDADNAACSSRPADAEKDSVISATAVSAIDESADVGAAAVPRASGLEAPPAIR